MAEWISLVTALFGAGEKSLDWLSKKSKNDPEMASQVLDLQNTMRELHDAWSSVSDENHELRLKIEDYDRWDETIAPYEKRRVEGGAVIFVHKDSDWDLVCPKCVQERSLHQLQDKKNMTGEFSCPNCGANYPVRRDEHEQFY